MLIMENHRKIMELCCGISVICILNDVTDNRADFQYKVQMVHLDGSVLDINATCANLGQKFLQLLRCIRSVVMIQPQGGGGGYSDIFTHT